MARRTQQARDTDPHIATRTSSSERTPDAPTIPQPAAHSRPVLGKPRASAWICICSAPRRSLSNRRKANPGNDILRSVNVRTPNTRHHESESCRTVQPKTVSNCVKLRRHAPKPVCTKHNRRFGRNILLRPTIERSIRTMYLRPEHAHDAGLIRKWQNYVALLRAGECRRHRQAADGEASWHVRRRRFHRSQNLHRQRQCGFRQSGETGQGESRTGGRGCSLMPTSPSASSCAPPPKCRMCWSAIRFPTRLRIAPLRSSWTGRHRPMPLPMPRASRMRKCGWANAKSISTTATEWPIPNCEFPPPDPVPLRNMNTIARLAGMAAKL